MAHCNLPWGTALEGLELLGHDREREREYKKMVQKQRKCSSFTGYEAQMVWEGGEEKHTRIAHDSVL